MKVKRLSTIFLAALLLGMISCYRPYGYKFYRRAPRFAPTNPMSVELLRREPGVDHIRLGEVWVRPDYRMDRLYVEGILREKAALMGANALVIVVDRTSQNIYDNDYWERPGRVYDRHIVGIAIRYRR